MKHQWKKNTLSLFVVLMGLFFILGSEEIPLEPDPQDDISGDLKDDVYGVYSVSEIVGFKSRKDATWVYERCEEIANHYYSIVSYLLENNQGMDEMTEYSNSNCDGKFIGFSELVTTYKLEEINMKIGGIQDGFLTINAFGKDRVFREPVSVDMSSREIELR